MERSKKNILLKLVITLIDVCKRLILILFEKSFIYQMINIIRFKVLLFYLLPVFYISGPFLSDLSLSLIGLLFIYIALFQKKIFLYIKKNLVFFFNFLLNINYKLNIFF